MEKLHDGTARVIPFEFTGNAGEYFKIWVVNVFLSVITLGVYSAWAKVRRKRYFYGNSLLESAPLEYLADPKNILKGRLIVFGVFVAYSVANQFAPVAESIFGIAFVFLLPWVIIRARSFNLRNSSYRNIRFDFRAAYGKAFKIFIGLPFIAALTLGIAYPYYVYRKNQFLVEHSGYGTSPFAFEARGRYFYPIYLKAGGLFVLIMAAVFLVGPGLAAAGIRSSFFAFFPGLFMILFILLVRAYIQASIINLVWNNMRSGEHRFESTLKPSWMLWLYFSNGVAILFSLGLLIPWATVRMARYRLANLRLVAAGSLDGFIAGEQEKISAAGEEFGDFFDFDFGL